MKSWLLNSPKNLNLASGVSAPLQENQVKVRLERAIVSFTDYSIYSGALTVPSYPLVLGRHGSGVVSETNGETNLIKGQHIVVEPYIPCGNCLFCKTNRPHMCQHMTILGLNNDGFYRDFITVPTKNVQLIPDNLSLTHALFTDYVSLALNIIDKLDINKGEHVAIMSANKLAFILAQVISYYQGIPIIIDDNNDYLENARNVNITYCFNSEEVNVPREVFSLTGGRMCDKVVYFTNTAVDPKDATDLISHNGKLCVAGFIPNAVDIDLSYIFAKRITVYTVNNGYGNYPCAINLLATQAVDVSALIDESWKFEQLDQLLVDFKEHIRYKCPIIEF